MEEYYKGSCVYFITDGEYVKIGATNDVGQRIKALQTANARELKVLKTIPTDDPYELEYTLHEQYADKRIKQEWYDILDEFKPKERWLKIKDIQRVFNISRATAINFVKTSKLPILQIGKIIRVRESDLSNYVELKMKENM